MMATTPPSPTFPGNNYDDALASPSFKATRTAVPTFPNDDDLQPRPHDLPSLPKDNCDGGHPHPRQRQQSPVPAPIFRIHVSRDSVGSFCSAYMCSLYCWRVSIARDDWPLWFRALVVSFTPSTSFAILTFLLAIPAVFVSISSFRMSLHSIHPSAMFLGHSPRLCADLSRQ